MSRSCFQALLLSGLTGSELLIFTYLLEICIEKPFSEQCEKEIADFFSTKTDRSNTYKRLSKLKKLDIIKKVTLNGKSGFMVNPIYCYYGSMRLRRFRVELWDKESIHSSSRQAALSDSFIHDNAK